jgi:hypothetical protein
LDFSLLPRHKVEFYIVVCKDKYLSSFQIHKSNGVFIEKVIGKIRDISRVEAASTKNEDLNILGSLI